MKHQDALDQLARETERARRRLMLERALRVGLPLLMAVGAWAFIAIIGLHEALPLMLQSATAALALAVFAYLGWRAWRAWRTSDQGHEPQR